MQSKINSFLKPNSPSSSTLRTLTLDPIYPLLDNNQSDDEEYDFTKESQVPIIYTPKTDWNIDDDDDDGVPDFGEQLVVPNLKNKKRKYAQFHLDLGQSDFMFRNCKTCGFKFVPGDYDDIKVHKEFHKNYTHSIILKGWRNERVIDTGSLESGRVILVTNDDPPAHIKKVHEVIKMMEMELGDGWIYHKHCKVYLFISSNQVAGCLVAEPIKKAYRLVSNSEVTTTKKEEKSTSTTLQFGGFSFHREIVRKNPSSKIESKSDESVIGAIIGEKDAVPAVCGIRAIWVTPSNRRKIRCHSFTRGHKEKFLLGFDP